MPSLVRYVFARLAIGFSIGAISVLILTLCSISIFGSLKSWLEIALMVWGVGSVFALGFLATALAMEDDR